MYAKQALFYPLMRPEDAVAFGGNDREVEDMSQIRVSNLTFGYEGSFDNIFEEVSFSVDTAWKLGFVGRNGKGKTTFLNLLLGKYEYSGCISSSVVFDYFPYTVSEKDSTRTAEELMEVWKPGVEGLESSV